MRHADKLSARRSCVDSAAAAVIVVERARLPIPSGWPRRTAKRCAKPCVRLSARVSTLEWEKTALTFAAESFGALAERLNVALRAIREAPRA